MRSLLIRYRLWRAGRIFLKMWRHYEEKEQNVLQPWHYMRDMK